jgi:membrane protease YdiL (CAAX protease family)
MIDNYWKGTNNANSKGILLSFILFVLIFIAILISYLRALPSIYSSALYYFVSILVPITFACFIEHENMKRLGLRIFRLKESVILTLVLGAIYASGLYLTLSSYGLQPSFDSLATPAVLAHLIAYFNPGFVEELPFRGYMQTRFQNRYGFYGVILVVILFALAHLPKYILARSMGFVSLCVNIMVLVVFSLFLMGYVYWKTNSIFSTILVHGTLGFSSGLILMTFFNIDEATLYQAIESNISAQVIFYTTLVVVSLATVLLSNVFFKESK